MIPRIIHYCWFGNGVMPKSQKDCIKSWEKLMPDYKIMRWDEDSFEVEKYSLAKHALNVKKYALVSDVCRYNVLYEYGGIYLDTDVEVFQRFDKYLSVRFFSAIELYNEFYTENIALMLNEDGSPKIKGIDIPRMEMLTSTIGSCPKNELIAELRDFYNNIQSDDDYAFNYRDHINNDRLVARYATKYGFRYVDKKQILDNDMVIYPTGIFGYAFSPNPEFEVSYHHNAASWEENVSSETKRRRKLDRLQLLGVYLSYKKLKKVIKKVIKGNR